MYITAEQALLLDKAVKSFEVAFRSFIVDSVIKKYPDVSSFSSHVATISPTSESLIYSQRIKNNLAQLKSKLDEKFNTILLCHQSFQNRVFDNDVPYVSELIDYFLLLFEPCFSQKSIVKSYSSVIEFHFNLSVYHRVRNNLSHPASRPIQETDASRVISFIKNCTHELNDKYFWYVGKREIIAYIDDINKINTKSSIKICNLYGGRIQYKRLLCRDEELAKLKSYMLGGDEIKRLSGSVALYGYGGVGKTALAVDFIQQVVKLSKEKELNIDFILFYTSKDEYLQSISTTGDLYIEKIRPEYDSLVSLIELIKRDLLLSSFDEITTKYKKGIIIIDNIENISVDEKKAIFKQIRNTPPSIQFIVTSRDEEQCDDKIHIEGFFDRDRGRKFIQEYIESEDLAITISDEEIDNLVHASKGNALILVQALNQISEGVVTISNVTASLLSIRSKNVEIIANFMYKNTFDSAIDELDSKGYKTKDIITVISLYNEPIEIYSISKLTGIDPSVSEEVCKKLSQRLVLNKTGEYYQLNEFAKRFVFIKLLPDKFHVDALKEKIQQHKERIEQKLYDLGRKINRNSRVKDILKDWQPKNYMDRIIIAELFLLHAEAEKVRKSKEDYEACLNELSGHELMSNHPYLSFQKARILKLGLNLYDGKEKESKIRDIERCFEDAIEGIEYEYTYIKGTKSHGSILMIFGTFLVEYKQDLKRAIRFLEEAKGILSSFKFSKVVFLSYDFLTRTLKQICDEGGQSIYRSKLSEIVTELLQMKANGNLGNFPIDPYEQKYKKFAKM